MTARFRAAARADLRAIARFLAEVHVRLGYPPDEARRMARQRLVAIVAAAERIDRAPGMGQPENGLSEGLRRVALERATYWYRIDDGDVVIEAVFTAGQDHLAHMRRRLAERGGT